MKEVTTQVLHNAADLFAVPGKRVSIERYGDGHINDTYLMVVAQDGQNSRYILQRINTSLFTDVEKLMHNIELVTSFNRKKVLERGGDPEREGLTLVKTTDGKTYCTVEGAAFRLYKFIEGATTYSSVQKPSDFYEAAVAFGRFAGLLAQFDASQLYEILPNFHNTVWRYENFDKAVKADVKGRAALVQKEIAWVESHKKMASIIVDLLKSNKIPLRVTHNDTKLNNVMIDDKTGKAIAVIDLDTVMPGSLCYDFGDSIRFGCNPCAEDEKDLSKVNFSLPLFEQFAKGYLFAVGDSITPLEREHLVTGAMLMTYECGMRFLTDYLQGDTYFHTNRDGQNLDRARTQFKLVDDMEQLKSKLDALVKKF